MKANWYEKLLFSYSKEHRLPSTVNRTISKNMIVHGPGN